MIEGFSDVTVLRHFQCAATKRESVTPVLVFKILMEEMALDNINSGISQGIGPESAQINFNVTARNSNQVIGIFYDAMQMTATYQEQSIGNSQLLTPFYQLPKNTTVLAGTFSGPMVTVTGTQWQQMLDDRSRGTVVFRVELTARIRFKIWSWKSKHHRMHANCPVGVGQDGMILAGYVDKRCPEYFN